MEVLLSMRKAHFRFARDASVSAATTRRPLKIAVSLTATAGTIDTCAVTASANGAPTKQDVVKAKLKVG
jgi:hypothetical protein